MFESIISKITNTVRNVARAVASVTRRSPWVAPTAIVLFFLFV